MKSEKLIKMLKEIDPSGEGEIVLHSGEDIFCLEAVPGYYDGNYTTLVLDESRNGEYNVIGAKYRADGTKIRIRGIDCQSALTDNPGLPVEVIPCDGHVPDSMQEKVDGWRMDSMEDDDEDN